MAAPLRIGLRRLPEVAGGCNPKPTNLMDNPDRVLNVNGGTCSRLFRALGGKKNLFLLMLLSVPFITYGIVVYIYATNVPYQDDFDAALDFVNRFTDANSLSARSKLIGRQHNEHRIVLDRFFFLGSYYLQDGVNFRTITILGNLGWVLTVMALVLIAYRRFHLSLARLLPIPWVMLSFVHYENMFFAMAAVQNYWFILWSVILMYSLSVNKRVGCLVVLFFMALFTSAGGVALYILANVFLVLQRNSKRFWHFFVASTLCMAVFFVRYRISLAGSNLPDQQPELLGRLVNFLAFLGNVFFPSFGASAAIVASVALGLIVGLVSLKIVIAPKSDNFLRLSLAFILTTALTVALTRSFGESQAQASRYSVYPLLALVLIYISGPTISKWVARRGGIWIALVLSVSVYLCAASIVEAKRFPAIRDQRISSIAAFSCGDRGKLLYAGDKRHASDILISSLRRQIFVLSRDCGNHIQS